MKEAMHNLDKGVEKMEKDIETQNETVQFLARSLDNANKREKTHRYFLYFIIVVLLAINGWFTYMFTTTSVVETTEETTTQEGVYNFTDSEGNIISSDLSLEEMQELIDINGNDQENN